MLRIRRKKPSTAFTSECEGLLQLHFRVHRIPEGKWRRRDLEYGVRCRQRRGGRQIWIFDEQGRGDRDDVFGGARLSGQQYSVQLHFSGASSYAVCGWVSEKELSGREQEMYEKLAQTQPIGRMGKPEEVASLALFLCSDAAAFITGVDYPLDGGFMNLHG